MVPCILHEDEHLLVIDKPAGLNTHAPAPFAGEGVYEWLRDREPRWASLAIIHRLDKDTSGIMVFGRTPAANKSLTSQFATREVRKTYFLLAARSLDQPEVTVRGALIRVGSKYQHRPVHAGCDLAETRFRLPAPEERARAIIPAGTHLVVAEPHTGRTHQIRVQSAHLGRPILGDALYAGAAYPRLCLHAAELSFRHPVTGRTMTFRAAIDFTADPALALRTQLIDPAETTAFRLLHGASDRQPGWYVDRLGDYLLASSDQPLTPAQQQELEGLRKQLRLSGAFHKLLRRTVRGADPEATAPRLVGGQAPAGRFSVRENGVAYELSFTEGYSVGLFLDQRDNRRRLLTGQVARGFALPAPKPGSSGERPEVLNTFAYTCAFSVCAAQAGARVTSVDLSRKYLEWGRQNFALNGLDPAAHDFIYGDVFEWLRRLGKKARKFDLVLLDPPTFSQSKESGVFRASADYTRLAEATLPLVKPGGVLFASTNAAEWPPAKFMAAIEQAAHSCQRRIRRTYYAPQPPDFPASAPEPPYLKTAWFQLE